MGKQGAFPCAVSPSGKEGMPVQISDNYKAKQVINLLLTLTGKRNHSFFSMWTFFFFFKAQVKSVIVGPCVLLASEELYFREPNLLWTFFFKAQVKSVIVGPCVL